MQLEMYSLQKIRDTRVNARNEDWSLQGAAAWKRKPQEEIPMAMEGQRSKIERTEIVIKGSRNDNFRRENRAGPSTTQTRKTLEGRSATFRVQGLVFLLTSIAARLLVTFFFKK